MTASNLLLSLSVISIFASAGALTTTASLLFTRRNGTFSTKTPGQPAFQSGGLLSPETGTCTAWGWNHYRTFDNRIFSYNGQCTYILAKSVGQFNILVDNNRLCPQKPCYRKIKLYFGDASIEIESVAGSVFVTWNGQHFQVPGSKSGSRFEKVGSLIVFRSSLGFIVKWDGKNYITVELPSSLQNQVSGLCGNFNGIPLDDFQARNGQTLTSVPNFVSSWKELSLRGPSCVESGSALGCKTNTVTNLAIEKSSTSRCQAIKYDNDFLYCHGIIDPEPYYQACRADCCDAKGLECMCSSMDAYSKACSEYGITLEWRKQGRCEIACSGGRVYKSCGSSCVADCAQSQAVCSDTECIEGCFCPDGWVLYNGNCVQTWQCPCYHNGKEYKAGDYIKEDCNQCQCNQGAWDCTKKVCDVRCCMYGDGHFHTFDHSVFNFLGKCSYYLLRTSDLDIVINSEGCDLGYECMRSLKITYLNQRITLDAKQRVFYDSHEVTHMPYSNHDFLISRISSLFIELKLSNGIGITWDGETRMHISAPPTFKGKTKGLCGTYDGKQGNDFMTPQHVWEANPVLFGNQWRTHKYCPDAHVKADPQPCETQLQRKPFAHMLCQNLKSPIFEECHGVFDVEEYYKNCMFDMCSCEKNLHDCLCPSLGFYADMCTARGVYIDWRLQVAECKLDCPAGQMYQICGRPCERTCRNYAENKDGACDGMCVEGCNCPDGQALNDNDECVPVPACPCFFGDKEYAPGFTTVIDKELCVCHGAKWQCQKVSNGSMVLNLQPLCGPFMEYTSCMPMCPDTCENTDDTEGTCEASMTCQEGCVCKPGYLLKGNECILKDDCPCTHGGKDYFDGDYFYMDCNKCTCKSHKWDCEQNECPATCTAYGDSHYTTFDGAKYDLQGSCDYILAQTVPGVKDEFAITITNVPCGTTGVTCSKGINIILGKERTSYYHNLHLVRGKTILNPPGSPFQIDQIGQMVFVQLPSGVTVEWDRGTRLYVRLPVHFMGKVEGLCANFNGNRNDDFASRPNGPVSKPTVFGDNWRLHSYCEPSKEIEDSCKLLPHRKTWAKLKCSIMTSEVFEPCHGTVPYEDYMERCVFDACACDQGGDCECLCTAVAAYAHECASNGIRIHWRTQDFCPLECTGCKEYNPCMSRCPKKTCENRLYFDNLTMNCQDERGICFEGCDLHPCVGGQVYDSLVEPITCIPEPLCQSPSCTIGTKNYKEGERIDDKTVCNEKCEICICRNGKIDHVTFGPGCKPVIEVVSTTPSTTKITTRLTPTPTVGCIEEGWTSWMSASVPSFNNVGDKETVVGLRKKYSFCEKRFIIGIKCRVIGQLQAGFYFGQQVTCNVNSGFSCRHSDQQRGLCMDYEISFYCDCDKDEGGIHTTTVTPESTTPFESTLPTVTPKAPTPSCGWTEWMNSFTPNPDGDEETMSNLRLAFSFCASPVQIKCRTVPDQSNPIGIGFDYAGQRAVSCDLNRGLICLNSVQAAGKSCFDYEVMVQCIDACTTITEISSSPTPTFGTTPGSTYITGTPGFSTTTRPTVDIYATSTGSTGEEYTTSTGSTAKEGTTSPGSTAKEYTTSTGSTTKEYTTYPGSTGKEYTTSPGSTAKEYTASTGSTTKEYTSPGSTGKEYTTSTGSTAKEYTTSPGSTAKEYTTSTGSTAKEYTTSTVSIGDKFASTGSTAKEYTTPPGSTGKEYTTPPGSTAKEYTTSPGSTGKEYTTPPGSTGKEYTTPPGSTGKEYTTPPGSTGKEYTTSPGSTGKEYTTSTGSTGKEYTTPPGSTGKEYTTPPGSTAKEYTTPPGSTGKEYTTSTGSTVKEYTTSTVSIGDKFASTGSTAKEYTTSTGSTAKEYTTPPGSTGKEYTTSPGSTGKEYTTSTGSTLDKYTPSPPVGSSGTTPVSSSSPPTATSTSSSSTPESSGYSTIHTQTTEFSTTNTPPVTDGKVCDDLLGLYSAVLMGDDHFKSSSSSDVAFDARNGRLNNSPHGPSNGGAWMPRLSDKTPEFEIDLKHPMAISGLITQGHPVVNQWVTQYEVFLSKDGRTFEPYSENNNGIAKVFTANFDSNTPVKVFFNDTITVRKLKIRPTGYFIRIALRLDLLTCASIAQSTPEIGSSTTTTTTTTTTTASTTTKAGEAPPCIKSKWLKFISRSTPETGGGDREFMSKQELSTLCSGTIIDINCYTTTGRDHRTTGDIVECNLQHGLECSNIRNNHTCMDYMVRYWCQCLPEDKTGTTTTTATTTSTTTTVSSSTTETTTPGEESSTATTVPSSTKGKTTLGEESSTSTTVPSSTKGETTLGEESSTSTTVPSSTKGKTTLGEESSTSTTVPSSTKGKTTPGEESSTSTTVPSSTKGKTTLGEESSTSTTVPSSTKGKTTLGEESSTATTVPSSTKGKTTLGEESSTSTTVPSSTKGKTTLGEESSTSTTVPSSTKGKTTLGEESSTSTTVPSSTKGKTTLGEESSTSTTVPSSTKGKTTLGEESSTSTTVPSSTKGKTTLGEESSTSTTVPSSTKGKTTLGEESSTSTTVPSSTKGKTTPGEESSTATTVPSSTKGKTPPAGESSTSTTVPSSTKGKTTLGEESSTSTTVPSSTKGKTTPGEESSTSTTVPSSTKGKTTPGEESSTSTTVPSSTKGKTTLGEESSTSTTVPSSTKGKTTLGEESSTSTTVPSSTKGKTTLGEESSTSTTVPSSTKGKTPPAGESKTSTTVPSSTKGKTTPGEESSTATTVPSSTKGKTPPAGESSTSTTVPSSTKGKTTLGEESSTSTTVPSSTKGKTTLGEESSTSTTVPSSTKGKTTLGEESSTSTTVPSSTKGKTTLGEESSTSTTVPSSTKGKTTLGEESSTSTTVPSSTKGKTTLGEESSTSTTVPSSTKGKTTLGEESSTITTVPSSTKGKTPPAGESKTSTTVPSSTKGKTTPGEESSTSTTVPSSTKGKTTLGEQSSTSTTVPSSTKGKTTPGEESSTATTFPSSTKGKTPPAGESSTSTTVSSSTKGKTTPSEESSTATTVSSSTPQSTLPYSTSTSESICVTRWSEWIDRNTDTSQIGDRERWDSQVLSQFCPGGTISDIRCFDTDTNQDYASFPEHSTCSISDGFTCINSLGHRPCRNYKIQYKCDCGDISTTMSSTPEPTTKKIQVGCGWSPWLNADTPKSGNGDLETITALKVTFGVCQNITGIDCRVAGTSTSHNMAGQLGVTCDVYNGLRCYNSDTLEGHCFDYEVKLLCWDESCEGTSTTAPTTPESTVHTTVVCPPGEEWQPCIYKCSDVCNYRGMKAGACEDPTKDDCIPGCQSITSNKTCNPHEKLNVQGVCIHKQLCPCLKPDGTPSKPLETWPNPDAPCTRCSCLNNKIECVQDPEGCDKMGRSTTPPSYTPSTPSSVCGWTEWMNGDSPGTNSGDMELITYLRASYGFCSTPLAIECREVLTKSDFRHVRQQVTCLVSEGLKCFNFNNNGWCMDYEIRVFCPCDNSSSIPTTAATTRKTRPPPQSSTTPRTFDCGWTNWMNNHITNSAGDIEDIPNLRQKYDFCATKDIINIQCRDTATNVTLTDDTEDVVCNVQYGLICFASQQPNNRCPDYEISFMCDPIGSDCSKFVSTPPPGTHTTPPGGYSTPTHLICNDDLGLENSEIPDHRITASSFRDTMHSTKYVRYGGPSSWMPYFNNQDQYVQVDLGVEDVIVTGIKTQGYAVAKTFVKLFTVLHSDDGVTWNTVKDKNNRNKIFTNSRGGPSIDYFDMPIRARFIRVKPIAWKGHISLRMELIGCPYNLTTTAMTTEYTTPSTIVTTLVTTEESRTRPTSPPTYSEKCVDWYPWLDLHRPSLNDTDDSEPVDDLFMATPGCSQVMAIQCRTATPDHTPYNYTGQNVECNTWNGLRCVSDKVNHQMCYDYEARIGCLKPSPECLRPPPKILTCYPGMDTKHCPEDGCAVGFYCNGTDCVRRAECPCLVDNTVVRPNGIMIDKDCDTCQCLNGEVICVPKVCPTTNCTQGFLGLNTTSCECQCDTCSPLEYPCGNGVCLPVERRCDGIVDCLDDEVGCGSSTTPFVPSVTTQTTGTTTTSQPTTTVTVIIQNTTQSTTDHTTTTPLSTSSTGTTVGKSGTTTERRTSESASPTTTGLVWSSTGGFITTTITPPGTTRGDVTSTSSTGSTTRKTTRGGEGSRTSSSPGVSTTTRGAEESTTSSSPGVSTTTRGAEESTISSSPGVSTTTRGAEESTTSSSPGVSTTTRGAEGSTTSSSPGVSTTTRGAEASTTSSSPGVSTTTRGADESTTSSSPGVSTTTRGAGKSTTSSSPGVSTTTRRADESTTSSSPGVSTTTRGAEESTTSSSPGVSTTTRRADESTTSSSPGVSTTTRRADESTTSSSPGVSTTTRRADESTTSSSPGVSTTTRGAGKSTTSSSPGVSTTTRRADESTTSSSPGVSTTTRRADESTTSSSPGVSTTTRRADESTTSSSPGVSTTTRRADESTTSSSPGVSTTTRRADESTTSSRPGVSTTTRRADESTTSSSPGVSTTTRRTDESTTSSSPGVSTTTRRADEATTSSSPGVSTTTRRADESTTSSSPGVRTTTRRADESTTSSIPSISTTTHAYSTTSGDYCALVTCPPLGNFHIVEGITVTLQKTPDGCCPRYSVCNVTQCDNPQTNCSAPHVSVPMPSKDCCPHYKCECPSECPKTVQPICPTGSKALTVPQACNCSTIVCTPVPELPSKCYYTRKVVTATAMGEISYKVVGVYKINETWTDGDCKECACIREGPAINPEISCTEQKCKTCNKGERLTPPKSGSCCGDCVQDGCFVNGTVYKAGEIIPSDRECYIKTCLKDAFADGYLIKSSQVKCPSLNTLPYCQKTENSTDPGGCCTKCIPLVVDKTGNCKPCLPELVFGNETESIGYFKVKQSSGAICHNSQPLKDLKECNGYCESGSKYTSLMQGLDNSCQCCQANETTSHRVKLTCSDGSTVTKTFKTPKSCACKSCSGGTEKPTPKKISQIPMSISRG